jgi:hypothetical protein
MNTKLLTASGLTALLMLLLLLPDTAGAGFLPPLPPMHAPPMTGFHGGPGFPPMRAMPALRGGFHGAPPPEFRGPTRFQAGSIGALRSGRVGRFGASRRGNAGIARNGLDGAFRTVSVCEAERSLPKPHFGVMR